MASNEMQPDHSSTTVKTNPIYKLDAFKVYMDNVLCDILKKISIDYNLNFDEMIRKYDISPPPVESSVKSSTKRKGRKKKPNAEFVEMTEFLYQEKKYLIDSQQNVYIFDEENNETAVLVGQKLVNGTVKFVDNYKP